MFNDEEYIKAGKVASLLAALTTILIYPSFIHILLSIVTAPILFSYILVFSQYFYEKYNKLNQRSFKNYNLEVLKTGFWYLSYLKGIGK